MTVKNIHNHNYDHVALIFGLSSFIFCSLYFIHQFPAIIIYLYGFSILCIYIYIYNILFFFFFFFFFSIILLAFINLVGILS